MSTTLLVAGSVVLVSMMAMIEGARGLINSNDRFTTFGAALSLVMGAALFAVTIGWTISLACTGAP